MAEANPEAHDDADTLLSGLENGDLTSGIYEGGFKTWECALDLASLAANLDLSEACHVVELGAGSAIPSLAVLQRFLSTRPSGHHASLKFTLCDYNEDVLRLATAPNVLLNFHHMLSSKNSGPSTEEKDQEEGELDVEELGENFVAHLMHDMHLRKLSFDFVSGGWGDAFVELVPESSSTSPTDNARPWNLLVLASETIYSPASIDSFADTLVRLLQRHSPGSAKAWVAAKKVYFGVGGGVDDFMQELQRLGAACRVLIETKDTGVGRVVLEVTAS